MSWGFLIFLTILFWGLYDVMYEKISSLLTPMLSFLFIAILQVIIFGLGYFFLEKGVERTIINKLPILLLAAILLSGGNLAFFYAFKSGASISVAIPAVTIGIAILGAFWGIFVAKESLTLSLVVGLILSTAGIYFIGLKK